MLKSLFAKAKEAADYAAGEALKHTKNIAEAGKELAKDGLDAARDTAADSLDYVKDKIERK